MKLLALLVTTLSFVTSGGIASSQGNIPEEVRRALEEADRLFQHDMKSEKYTEVARACAAKHGLPLVPKNATEVARSFGAAKAMAYGECVANTMYPAPR